MASNLGPRAVTDGLILYFDAANPKSYPGTGTTWSDLSGSGNHGTLVNGVGYTSDVKGALTFDGVNDYVSLASTPQIAQSVYSSTVEVVAYGDRTDATEVMFGGGALVTNQAYYLAFLSSDGSNFTFGFQGNNQSGSTPRSNVNWNHYAGLYDNSAGSRFRYFNQGLLSPSESSGVSNTSAATFTIGAFDDVSVGVRFFLQGKIASVKVYNRSLTSDEIQQNYNATRARYGL